jgi:hypothetical protein
MSDNGKKNVIAMNPTWRMKKQSNLNGKHKNGLLQSPPVGGSFVMTEEVIVMKDETNKTILRIFLSIFATLR